MELSGMIKKIAYATVWVLDQERAKEFYVNKLGFEVRSDERLGSSRWLTVAPKGQDVAFVLMPVAANPMMDAAAAATLRGLVERGMLVAVQKFAGAMESLFNKCIICASTPDQREHVMQVDRAAAQCVKPPVMPLTHEQRRVANPSVFRMQEVCHPRR
jgi:hypothetical protein